MRRRTKGCYFAFILGLSLVWVVLPILTQSADASSISIVIVNGSGISRDDYNREISQVRKRISRQGKFPSESQLSEIKKRILEQMISRELLYQQSQRMGVKVKASEIDERFELLKKRFANESEFNIALQEQNLYVDTIKARIKRGIAIKQLIDRQIVPKVKVTDKETRSFYDNNPQFFKKSEQERAGHILKKPESSYSYEEIKDAISQDINRKKIEKEVNRYIEKLKKNADVQRFPE